MKFLFLIFIFLFFNKHSFSNDLFQSSFYDVEFISNNIEDDKIDEINKIKTLSFLRILEKTLNKKNYNQINKNLSNDLINTFIKNIIINDEKIINDKYVSKIKINFNKHKIIDFFRNQNVPYVEYQPSKFLLIIYEKDGINENLFTKNNNFYKYFNNNLNENNIFQIPNLDINDRFLLKKEDLKNKNYEKIKNFKNKYNVDDVIIVIASISENKVIYNLILLSDEKFFEKKIDFNDYKFDIFFKIVENESIDMWKNINQIETDVVNLINCQVDYFNLGELKEIRNNLKNISIIKDININSLSYKSIQYDIYFYGNLKILKKIIKLNKLIINDNSDLCIIKLK